MPDWISFEAVESAFVWPSGSARIPKQRVLFMALFFCVNIAFGKLRSLDGGGFNHQYVKCGKCLETKLPPPLPLPPRPPWRRLASPSPALKTCVMIWCDQGHGWAAAPAAACSHAHGFHPLTLLQSACGIAHSACAQQVYHYIHRIFVFMSTLHSQLFFVLIGHIHFHPKKTDLHFTFLLISSYATTNVATFAKVLAKTATTQWPLLKTFLLYGSKKYYILRSIILNAMLHYYLWLTEVN